MTQENTLAVPVTRTPPTRIQTGDSVSWKTHIASALNKLCKRRCVHKLLRAPTFCTTSFIEKSKHGNESLTVNRNRIYSKKVFQICTELYSAVLAVSEQMTE